MSQLPPAFKLKEEDVKLMLAADVHIGDRNCESVMRNYVYKCRKDGVHIIDLRKTWEKIILAARIIVTFENPSDVCVVATSTQGSLPIAQRATLKLAHYLGAHAIAGKFTPGSFTNYIQADYYEPRLLIVANPYKDHQPVTESSYVNLPVIALCNTDSPLRHVDVAIPCNNKGRYSVALVMWLLTREVLRLRDKISSTAPWDVMVDMFIQPDQEEIEKAEAEQSRIVQDTFIDNSIPAAPEIDPNPDTIVGSLSSPSVQVAST
ncbi:40S ribosomal protein SA-like [Schistocerca gregaria]|uniref:40S ribosomal protein SA-like n=1 Tax=Schistocerca gregaria TaxID=7010 RepID=UPI00211E27CF|nr:40S ribosomal protein SA-like [Schistocerca gregaria]